MFYFLAIPEQPDGVDESVLDESLKEKITYVESPVLNASPTTVDPENVVSIYAIINFIVCNIIYKFHFFQHYQLNFCTRFFQHKKLCARLFFVHGSYILPYNTVPFLNAVH